MNLPFNTYLVYTPPCRSEPPVNNCQVNPAPISHTAQHSTLNTAQHYQHSTINTAQHHQHHSTLTRNTKHSTVSVGIRDLSLCTKHLTHQQNSTLNNKHLHSTVITGHSRLITFNEHLTQNSSNMVLKLLNTK